MAHDALAPSFPASETEAAVRRRERLAWTVLWLAFATFCVVAIGLIVGVSWYRDQSLSARVATVDVLAGTLLHQTQAAVRESVWVDGTPLQEGDRIRTADGRAFVALPDGSNVTLWPETTIEIEQLRTSSFNDNRTVIVLTQTSGHARYEVAVPSTLERRFEVQTPQALGLLREGSYRVELGSYGTDLSVRSGSASVSSGGQTIEVIRGERAVAGPRGGPALGSSTRNLIVNGDFSRGFDGWHHGSRNEEDGVSGQVHLTQQDGRFVVRMRRQGSEKHGETFLHQSINRDVTDEVSLKLHVDVKVVEQTLSGGGWRGSEYPVLVRLRYRDAYGSEATVARGFYVSNPDGHPTTNGTKLPANQWLPMTLDLFDERQVLPRPAYLMWIEVEASGWDYESFVTGVQLLAE